MGACPRWEQWLPPLTSTGGQCNIKVPSAGLLCPTHPEGGPWAQESGSAGYIWNPWWTGARPGGLGGMQGHLRIKFVCLFSVWFCLDFRVSEGTY